MPQGSFVCQEGAPVGPHRARAAHCILRVSQNAQIRNQEPAHNNAHIMQACMHGQEPAHVMHTSCKPAGRHGQTPGS